MSVRSPIVLFSVYGLCLVLVAVLQSPVLALSLLAMGLISAVMSLGINMQWGYAGLLNIGSMGFAALGGATAIWVAAPPVPEAWDAGGMEMLTAFAITLATVGILMGLKHVPIQHPAFHKLAKVIIIIGAYLIVRPIFTDAVDKIEDVNPSLQGYLGGFGLPIILSWIVGAVFAAAAAWLIGKVALGLRADYLGIATLGIAEILVAVLRNEDWLTRGVKNVIGLKRPIPDEVILVEWDSVIAMAQFFAIPVDDMTTILVRAGYCIMFGIVVALLLWFSETALRAPWGRMMHAIRDNETASRAMGKNVTKLHLQVFIIGSAVVGLSGAMLVTLDGQFAPTGYQPLRFTFLIWVMVLLGGSGNNWGSVLGGMVIWLFWIEAGTVGTAVMEFLTYPLADDNVVKLHLLENAMQMRLLLMGVLLLLVMRFSPGGLIPEKRK